MRVRGVVAALAAWSMIGCGGSGSPLASSGPSYALEIVGGLDQVAEATLAVAEPPAVRVLRDGEPVAGERIDFRIIDGDGNGTIVVTSGADGVARMPIWVLGPVLGPQRLLATLLSAPSITRNFVAQAVAPVAESALFDRPVFRVYSVPASTDLWGIQGGNSFWVRVVSRAGAPVPGHPVQWSVLSGGATIVAADGSTDATGTARLRQVAFPTRAGDTVVVQATVPGVSAPNSGTFSFVVVAGEATNIVVVEGGGQVAPAGSALPNRLKLHVLDAFGNRSGSNNLSFLVRGGGGTIGGADSVAGWFPTADTAYLAPPWVLGDAGPQLLRIRLGGLNPPVEWTSIEVGATATAP
ncbi:MAG TPA: Ig-like domain-containing protein [Gemmatimonadales bacterium]|nr:Ig-like domain-containing protein [Gemmatimonadales bacterium]HRX18991.1 Ig-like domain-containing protein [Gemmatimonadales bacterium]